MSTVLSCCRYEAAVSSLAVIEPHICASVCLCSGWLASHAARSTTWTRLVEYSADVRSANMTSLSLCCDVILHLGPEGRVTAERSRLTSVCWTHWWNQCHPAVLMMCSSAELHGGCPPVFSIPHPPFNIFLTPSLLCLCVQSSLCPTRRSSTSKTWTWRRCWPARCWGTSWVRWRTYGSLSVWMPSTSPRRWTAAAECPCPSTTWRKGEGAFHFPHWRGADPVPLVFFSF